MVPQPRTKHNEADFTVQSNEEWEGELTKQGEVVDVVYQLSGPQTNYFISFPGIFLQAKKKILIKKYLKKACTGVTGLER